jgi:hypothetical protein
MILIGIVLCSAAVAYIPGLFVRECSHCKAHVVQEDTISGDTICEVYWTDGKREAKMLPDHPWLVRCPVCLNLFWVIEAEVVDSGFEAAKGKPQVMTPSENEIHDFLTRPEALLKEKEIYRRIRLWWAANDAWRSVPNPNSPFSKEQVQDLDALSTRLDESLPSHRILETEIARELGRFEDCLLLLSYQFEVGYPRKPSGREGPCA